MSRTVFIAIVCVSVLAQSLTAAQVKHPIVYIDKGICPGEGCSYQGSAKVVRRTTAYAAPNAKSAPLFNLAAGNVVSSLKSEVHTVAGRFVVKRSYGKYRMGDVLWVYTYLGEGVFRVWYRGKMYEEQLEFSPWGGSAGKRCEQDDKHCWGELEAELKMTWWLKVRNKNGRVGWIRVNGNLEYANQG